MQLDRKNPKIGPIINLVININRKAKKILFDAANIGSSHGSGEFWNICKPFFSNKGNNVNERIILVEEETVIANDEELAVIFNQYFNTTTNGLNISKWNGNFIPNILLMLLP